MKERIHKILSGFGVGSRREIESLIKQGRVFINGNKANLGQKISIKDKVKIDNRIISFPKFQFPLRIIIYNKRIGEVSTRKDPQGRSTIFDSLPELRDSRWISVGRLDINTSGLMLFTNKGEIANKLMHPSSRIEREYIVRVQGEVKEEHLRKLTEGIELEDGLARFTDIQRGRRGKTNQWFAMVILEGRSREVRRLWESQGFQISRLKRVRMGNIFLPTNLSLGKFKDLNEKEIKHLLA